MSLLVMKIEKKYWHVVSWEKQREFLLLFFFLFPKKKNRSIPRPPINAREKGRDLSNNPFRYFVPQVPITCTWKMLNGYPMFSVKNIVQNVELIELWGKNLVPLHFVISKSSFFWFFPIGRNVKVRVI